MQLITDHDYNQASSMIIYSLLLNSPIGISAEP